jgi:hypothetical protein
MAFIIGLPVCQIILFCLAIGHDPTGLNIAVANHELSEAQLSEQNCPIYSGCNYTLLSCRYLEFLKNRSVVVVSRVACEEICIIMRLNFVISQQFFGTEEEAREVVRRGKAWGALSFAHNYTDSLVERTDFGQNAPDYILESAELNVNLDMSSKQ